MRWRLTIAAISLSAALVIQRSVLGNFNSRMVGAPGDREWYVYISWKIGEALRHGVSPFHLTGLSAPYGYNVLVGDGFLPPFVGGFLNLIFGPIASYNLLLMASTVLGVVSGLYLARRITPYRSAQLITALAVASAPVLFPRFQGHLSLCFTFPIILAVAEALEIGRRNGRVHVVRIVIWLFLAFGSTVYFFIISVGVLGAAVLYRCLRDRPDRRKVLVQFAISLAVVGVLIAPFIYQRLQFTSAELDAGSFFDSTFATDGIVYNADVLSIGLPTYPTLVDMPGTVRFQRNIVPPSGEGNFSFPGVLLVTLGVGGLLALRRRETLPVLVAAGVLWILTLGPVADVYGQNTVGVPENRVQWLPFKVLGELPFLSGLRAPGRLSLGLPPLLAVGLALALHQCFVRRREVETAVAEAHRAVTGDRRRPSGLQRAHASRRRRRLPERIRRRRCCGPSASCPGVSVGSPRCRRARVRTSGSNRAWRSGTASTPSAVKEPFLALPFASEMKAYRDSPDLAALRCEPDILGYVFTGFPREWTTLTDDLADLRVDLGIRFLIVDKAYLPLCPGVDSVVQRLRQRYEVIPGDAQWEAIDLDSPTS